VAAMVFTTYIFHEKDIEVAFFMG